MYQTDYKYIVSSTIKTVVKIKAFSVLVEIYAIEQIKCLHVLYSFCSNKYYTLNKYPVVKPFCL